MWNSYHCMSSLRHQLPQSINTSDIAKPCTDFLLDSTNMTGALSAGGSVE